MSLKKCFAGVLLAAGVYMFLDTSITGAILADVSVDSAKIHYNALIGLALIVLAGLIMSKD